MSASLYANYCETDDFDNTTTCALTIETKSGLYGSKIIFLITLGKEDSNWLLMTYMVFEDWAYIKGDAKIKIDGGEVQTITHITTQRDVIDGDVVVEAAIYSPSEDLLNAIADSKEEIWLRLPSGSGSHDLKSPSSKFSKLRALMSEVKALQ